jgi:hypothetical protein
MVPERHLSFLAARAVMRGLPFRCHRRLQALKAERTIDSGLPHIAPRSGRVPSPSPSQLPSQSGTVMRERSKSTSFQT